jgi:pimeloyl-ACP methyl ester carboxylesterase
MLDMKKFLVTLAFILLLPLLLLLLLQKRAIPFEILTERYANEHSQFLEWEGMQVHYRIEGKGKPIVLIHGTGACLQTWDVWTDSLKDDYQVIRMDIPAFGLTGPNAQNSYTMEYYVKFIEAFTQKLGLQDFVLGGNSLGGGIAWQYALKYPERVQALLLVAPSGSPVRAYNFGRFSIFRLARIPVLSTLLTGTDTRFMVERTLMEAASIHDHITEERIEMYYDMSMRKGNRKAFVARLAEAAKDPVLDPSKVEVPTLILWGDEDKVLPIVQLEGFQSMPFKEIIVYEGVGHTPQEEIPAKSVRDVKSFLELLPIVMQARLLEALEESSTAL